ncbi:NKG2-A/NKG2-B type II integral membrane protein-like [Carlito syrichta]|uniref:NKG2-A/NKG2-B type II integral membrane protein-like n=1 Tax=Carlito syrichta TaxID=1868482 RepID=A0A3Q0EBE4_CARSF|nr:NKG2-A/NKG2-B type II integral membrane protein-like [Carlito syrichta]
MDNHRVIYSKLNLPPNPKNQERKSKGKKSSILVTEQEITYAELSLQTASQDLLDNDKTFHSKATATQKQTNSFQNENNQKIYNCSCPEEWFTYSNSCYYIGKETKTWEESMMACASMNSSLLYIDDEEDMVGL